MVRNRIYSVSALPIESTHFCTQYPYHRLAVVTTTTTTSVYPLLPPARSNADGRNDLWGLYPQTRTPTEPAVAREIQIA